MAGRRKRKVRPFLNLRTLYARGKEEGYFERVQGREKRKRDVPFEEKRACSYRGGREEGREKTIKKASSMKERRGRIDSLYNFPRGLAITAETKKREGPNGGGRRKRGRRSILLQQEKTSSLSSLMCTEERKKVKKGSKREEKKKGKVQKNNVYAYSQGGKKGEVRLRLAGKEKEE